jgi:hypothetical protein
MRILRNPEKERRQVNSWPLSLFLFKVIVCVFCHHFPCVLFTAMVPILITSPECLSRMETPKEGMCSSWDKLIAYSSRPGCVYNKKNLAKQ